MAKDKETVGVCTGQIAPIAFTPGTHKLVRKGGGGRVVNNADEGCCTIF
jgi:hypothetical protein